MLMTWQRVLQQKRKCKKGVDQVSDSCDSYDLTISIKKTEVVYQTAPGMPYKEPLYLLRSFAPSTASRLAVTSFLRKGVQLLVNRLLYKHAPSFFIGAIHKKKKKKKKMLFPIPFRTDLTRKAIAVNSLLCQLQLAPLKQ